MRRWRTSDDRFLVEGDLPSGIQFYRLDRDHNVDRVYKEERRSLGGEVHTVSFSQLGRQLMCRHTIDRGRKIEDESRVELDGLEPLTPSEEPTEKTARASIARHRVGAQAMDAAKRAKIDKLAAAAPESIRPTYKRLAEGVVLNSDPLCRQMISIFAGLAALSKDASSRDVASEVSPLIELAAQLLTADPAAKHAELPTLPDSKAMALVDSIDRLRHDVLTQAAEGDNFSESGSSAVALGRVADVLRVASIRLLGSESLT